MNFRHLHKLSVLYDKLLIRVPNQNILKSVVADIIDSGLASRCVQKCIPVVPQLSDPSSTTRKACLLSCAPRPVTRRRYVAIKSGSRATRNFRGSMRNTRASRRRSDRLSKREETRKTDKFQCTPTKKQARYSKEVELKKILSTLIRNACRKFEHTFPRRADSSLGFMNACHVESIIRRDQRNKQPSKKISPSPNAQKKLLGGPKNVFPMQDPKRFYSTKTPPRPPKTRKSKTSITSNPSKSKYPPSVPDKKGPKPVKGPKKSASAQSSCPEPPSETESQGLPFFYRKVTKEENGEKKEELQRVYFLYPDKEIIPVQSQIEIPFEDNQIYQEIDILEDTGKTEDNKDVEVEYVREVVTKTVEKISEAEYLKAIQEPPEEHLENEYIKTLIPRPESGGHPNNVTIEYKRKMSAQSSNILLQDLEEESVLFERIESKILFPSEKFVEQREDIDKEETPTYDLPIINFVRPENKEELITSSIEANASPESQLEKEEFYLNTINDDASYCRKMMQELEDEFNTEKTTDKLNFKPEEMKYFKRHDLNIDSILEMDSDVRKHPLDPTYEDSEVQYQDKLSKLDLDNDGIIVSISDFSGLKPNPMKPGSVTNAKFDHLLKQTYKNINKDMQRKILKNSIQYDAKYNDLEDVKICNDSDKVNSKNHKSPVEVTERKSLIYPKNMLNPGYKKYEVKKKNDVETKIEKSSVKDCIEANANKSGTRKRPNTIANRDSFQNIMKKSASLPGPYKNRFFKPTSDSTVSKKLSPPPKPSLVIPAPMEKVSENESVTIKKFEGKMAKPNFLETIYDKKDAKDDSVKQQNKLEKRRIIIFPEVNHEEFEELDMKKPQKKIGILNISLKTPPTTRKEPLVFSTRKSEKEVDQMQDKEDSQPFPNLLDAFQEVKTKINEEGIRKVEKICKEELKSLEPSQILEQELESKNQSHETRKKTNFSRYYDQSDENKNIKKSVLAGQHEKNQDYDPKPKKIMSVIDRIWAQVEEEAKKVVKEMEIDKKKLESQTEQLKNLELKIAELNAPKKTANYRNTPKNTETKSNRVGEEIKAINNVHIVDDSKEQQKTEQVQKSDSETEVFYDTKSELPNDVQIQEIKDMISTEEKSKFEIDPTKKIIEAESEKVTGKNGNQIIKELNTYKSQATSSNLQSKVTNLNLSVLENVDGAFKSDPSKKLSIKTETQKLNQDLNKNEGCKIIKETNIPIIQKMNQTSAKYNEDKMFKMKDNKQLQEKEIVSNVMKQNEKISPALKQCEVTSRNQKAVQSIPKFEFSPSSKILTSRESKENKTESTKEKAPARIFDPSDNKPPKLILKPENHAQKKDQLFSPQKDLTRKKSTSTCNDAKMSLRNETKKKIEEKASGDGSSKKMTTKSSTSCSLNKTNSLNPRKSISTSSCHLKRKREKTGPMGPNYQNPCRKNSKNPCDKKKDGCSCCKTKKKDKKKKKRCGCTSSKVVKKSVKCVKKKTSTCKQDKKASPCKKVFVKSSKNVCSKTCKKEDPCKNLKTDAFNYVCRKEDRDKKAKKGSSHCKTSSQKSSASKICASSKKDKFDPCKGSGLPKKTAVKIGVRHCAGNRLGPQKKSKKTTSPCKAVSKKSSPCKKSSSSTSSKCKKSNPCKKTSSSISCKSKKINPCKKKSSTSCKPKKLKPSSCASSKSVKKKSRTQLPGPVCKKSGSSSSQKCSPCKKSSSKTSRKSNPCEKTSSGTSCKKASKTIPRSDPCKELSERSKGRANAACAKGKGNPCKKSPSSTSHKCSPCKKSSKTSQRSSSPCKKSSKTSQRSSSPCKKSSKTSQRSSSPCKKSSKTSQKSNPCEKLFKKAQERGRAACAAGRINPCKISPSSSSRQLSPCKKASKTSQKGNPCRELFKKAQDRGRAACASGKINPCKITPSNSSQKGSPCKKSSSKTSWKCTPCKKSSSFTSCKSKKSNPCKKSSSSTSCKSEKSNPCKKSPSSTSCKSKKNNPCSSQGSSLCKTASKSIPRSDPCKELFERCKSRANAACAAGEKSSPCKKASKTSQKSNPCKVLFKKAQDKCKAACAAGKINPCKISPSSSSQKSSPCRKISSTSSCGSQKKSAKKKSSTKLAAPVCKKSASKSSQKGSPCKKASKTIPRSDPCKELFERCKSRANVACAKGDKSSPCKKASKTSQKSNPCKELFKKAQDKGKAACAAGKINPCKISPSSSSQKSSPCRKISSTSSCKSQKKSTRKKSSTKLAAPVCKKSASKSSQKVSPCKKSTKTIPRSDPCKELFERCKSRANVACAEGERSSPCAKASKTSQKSNPCKVLYKKAQDKGRAACASGKINPCKITPSSSSQECSPCRKTSSVSSCKSQTKSAKKKSSTKLAAPVCKKSASRSSQKGSPCKKASKTIPRSDPCKELFERCKSRANVACAEGEKKSPCKKASKASQKSNPCKELFKKAQDKGKAACAAGKINPCKISPSSSSQKCSPCKKTSSTSSCKSQKKSTRKKSSTKLAAPVCKKSASKSSQKGSPCKKASQTIPRSDPCKELFDRCKGRANAACTTEKANSCKKSASSASHKCIPCKKSSKTSQRSRSPCKKSSKTSQKRSPCKKASETIPRSDPCKELFERCKARASPVCAAGEKNSPCKKASKTSQKKNPCKELFEKAQERGKAACAAGIINPCKITPSSSSQTSSPCKKSSSCTSQKINLCQDLKKSDKKFSKCKFATNNPCKISTSQTSASNPCKRSSSRSQNKDPCKKLSSKSITKNPCKKSSSCISKKSSRRKKSDKKKDSSKEVSMHRSGIKLVGPVCKKPGSSSKCDPCKKKKKKDEKPKDPCREELCEFLLKDGLEEETFALDKRGGKRSSGIILVAPSCKKAKSTTSVASKPSKSKSKKCGILSWFSKGKKDEKSTKTSASTSSPAVNASTNVSYRKTCATKLIGPVCSKGRKCKIKKKCSPCKKSSTSSPCKKSVSCLPASLNPTCKISSCTSQRSRSCTSQKSKDSCEILFKRKSINDIYKKSSSYSSSRSKNRLKCAKKGLPSKKYNPCKKSSRRNRLSAYSSKKSTRPEKSICTFKTKDPSASRGTSCKRTESNCVRKALPSKKYNPCKRSSSKKLPKKYASCTSIKSKPCKKSQTKCKRSHSKKSLSCSSGKSSKSSTCSFRKYKARKKSAIKLPKFTCRPIKKTVKKCDPCLSLYKKRKSGEEKTSPCKQKRERSSKSVSKTSQKSCKRKSNTSVCKGNQSQDFKKWLVHKIPCKERKTGDKKLEKKGSCLPKPTCRKSKGNLCANTKKSERTFLVPGSPPTSTIIKLCKPLSKSKGFTGKQEIKKKKVLPGPECKSSKDLKLGKANKYKTDKNAPSKSSLKLKLASKSEPKSKCEMKMKTSKSDPQCYPSMKITIPKKPEPVYNLDSLKDNPAAKFHKLKLAKSNSVMSTREDVFRAQTPFKPPRIYKVKTYQFTFLGPKAKHTKDNFDITCRRKQKKVKQSKKEDGIVCNDISTCPKAKKMIVDNKYLCRVEKMIEVKQCISHDAFSKLRADLQGKLEETPPYLQILKHLQKEKSTEFIPGKTRSRTTSKTKCQSRTSSRGSCDRQK